SASIDRGNRSIEALRRELGTIDAELLEQLPFKSQNRYSAVRLRDGGATRFLVLGAVEVLRGRFARPVPQLDTTAPSVEQQGLRLLLLCEGRGETVLSDTRVVPEVPLRPVCLVCMGDELRPEAATVIEKLSAQGIGFKVLSGDNPQTVQGTIRKLDLPW